MVVNRRHSSVVGFLFLGVAKKGLLVAGEVWYEMVRGYREARSVIGCGELLHSGSSVGDPYLL